MIAEETHRQKQSPPIPVEVGWSTLRAAAIATAASAALPPSCSILTPIVLASGCDEEAIPDNECTGDLLELYCHESANGFSDILPLDGIFTP